MDQSTLVGSQIRSGYALAQRFLAEGNPLTLAFWLRLPEDDFWSLYIVTTLVDKEGSAETYLAIDQSFEKLPKPQKLHLPIKAISPTSSLAKEVVEFLNFNYTDYAISSGLGKGVFVDDKMYVYIKSNFDSTTENSPAGEDIGQELLRLMSQGPNATQPQVTMKDGTYFSGVPFSIELGSEMTVVARFVVEHETVPRLVPLDKIASIN